MKMGMLGNFLKKSAPKMVNSANKLEDAFDFSMIMELPGRPQRSLVLLYSTGGYCFLKTFCYFLLSDDVCMIFPESLTTDQKKNIEKIFNPNIIVDRERTDLDCEYFSLEKTNMFLNSSQVHLLAPELKALMSTSGVTGSPKIAKLSHSNILANIDQVLSMKPILASDICLLYQPLSFVMGLTVLTSHLASSATIVPNTEVVLSKAFWERMKKFQVTFFSGVPLRYEVLLANQFKDLEQIPLNYMTVGGGRLRDESFLAVVDYCKKRGIAFYNVLGQTEACGRLAFLDLENAASKVGAVGRAVKNGKLRVDSTGELIYSGPNVFGGYASDIQGLSFFEYIDELRTGDLARIDDEGFFYITGRIKRIIKLIGLRISLDECENFLSSALNRPLYCCGIDDGFLLVVSESTDILPVFVKEFLSKYMANISLDLIRIRRIDKIPSTDRGKIDYQKILAMENSGLLIEY